MSVIVIERPGLLSTIQDAGRFNLRHLGIPWSGCLTPLWQKMANQLVHNPTDHSVIESWEGGFQFRTEESPVRFTVVAHSSAQIFVDDGTTTTQISANQSYTAPPTSSVSLKSTGQYRHAIVAIEGLAAQQQLGSTSTYAKAKLGGLNGQALNAGDKLSVLEASQAPEQQYNDASSQFFDRNELRVVFGPQADHFSAEGKENLLSQTYTLGSDADRMGVRLNGPPVSHLNDASKDIVSDAIVPGSIQVPGTGQPIVLLNDAHTAGGYPKVATVISIDLPLLGLHRPGSTFSFRELSIDEAVETVREHRTSVEDMLSSIKPVQGSIINTEMLFANNLIDGVIDGTQP